MSSVFRIKRMRKIKIDKPVKVHPFGIIKTLAKELILPSNPRRHMKIRQIWSKTAAQTDFRCIATKSMTNMTVRGRSGFHQIRKSSIKNPQ